MAKLSNRDRVGRAFEQFAAGAEPYVDRRMRRFHPAKDDWFERWLGSAPEGIGADAELNDPQVLLLVLEEFWKVAFRQELSKQVRNAVFSLSARRRDWADQKPFQFDDAYRTLDEIEQILVAVDAPEAAAIGTEKAEFMRLRVEEEARKLAADPSAIAAGTEVAGLRPWREVIQPHDDVAQGTYMLAEFAADLHAVQGGTSSSEYSDAVEFFRRTFLTEGLSNLLVGAAQRVSGGSGAPVVDLQTNFGGGKTHSMIALYHLFSGTPLAELPDELRDVLAAEDITEVPAVPRAVLVGTAMKPGQPEIKDDGTQVRTMWGELAWQLGGRAAFDLVAESDRTSTSPGDALDDVFDLVGPCLILIDEWVAYSRQLYGDENLPAGSFDTHFSFAQALTESVKRRPGVLMVASIPASASPDDDEPIGSEAELGGYGGKESLARLRAVVGRLESSWRPASAEESFEIVRRRLFKPVDPAQAEHRDATAEAFAEYYRRQAAELPEDVRSPRYVDQIRQAYPIHPELFERLYQDWSTLDRFQRTRGVLRLMASVINALWEAGDQSPLIMPSSLPLELTKVNQELLRNLEDSFKPVLDTDVDGETSVSRSLDREFPNLGRYQAARKVARAVFFGAAPTLKSANRGIEAQRVRLACAMPGETIETYGDALKRLSDRASFLYVEGSRYWFDTQQSVVRQAQEQAKRLLEQNLDEVHAEIVDRLRAAARDRGEFAAVHVAPTSTEDVSDEDRLRLVILPPDQPYLEKSEQSVARSSIDELLSHRGGSARTCRNMLVFLAPDSQAIDHLEQATAEYLAWSRIVDDADALNLDKSQERQAKERRQRADDAIRIRIAETYRWLIVPRQETTAGAPVELAVLKVEGQSGLAVRASDRLQREGTLCLQYSPVLLRALLDGVLAREWADGHVRVGRLWEIFSQYPYLPKLRDRDVLLATVAAGPASISWQAEGFAIADVDQGDRYGGLVLGEVALRVVDDTLVVRPDVAAGQREAEVDEGAPAVAGGGDPGSTGDGGSTPGGVEVPAVDPGAAPVTRFQGALRIDPTRPVREFQLLADEILVNLSAAGEVTISVEITGHAPNGYDDAVVRTVTENAKVLKLEPGTGFERD